MSVNDLNRTQKVVAKELFEVVSGSLCSVVRLFLNNASILQKKGSTEFSTTYVFGNEDHTLGNVLRYVLMQQPETDFCGYSVPHPYEPQMNVRLQTKGVATGKVLLKGFTGMEKLCDDLLDCFNTEVAAYKRANA